MKILNNLKYQLGTAALMATSYARQAFANNGNTSGFAGGTPDSLGLPDATDSTDVRDTIVDIIEIVLNFLGLIAVIVIIIAGIRLIVSQGEEEQKDKAKKTILYAIIGLIVVLFARVIVSLVTVYLAEELEVGS